MQINWRSQQLWMFGGLEIYARLTRQPAIFHAQSLLSAEKDERLHLGWSMETWQYASIYLESSIETIHCIGKPVIQRFNLYRFSKSKCQGTTFEIVHYCPAHYLVRQPFGESLTRHCLMNSKHCLSNASSNLPKKSMAWERNCGIDDLILSCNGDGGFARTARHWTSTAKIAAPRSGSSSGAYKQNFLDTNWSKTYEIWGSVAEMHHTHLCAVLTEFANPNIVLLGRPFLESLGDELCPSAISSHMSMRIERRLWISFWISFL